MVAEALLQGEFKRLVIQPRQPGWDLIIRARREAYGAAFDALRAELLSWREAVLARG